MIESINPAEIELKSHQRFGLQSRHYCMRFLSLCALLSAAAIALGQDFSHFEAASVKPTAVVILANGGVPAPVIHGGPGTDDPGRISWRGTGLGNLIITGYETPSFRIAYPPDFKAERYDIEATLPPGATARQFHVMLQNLLIERFHIVVHHEDRIIPVYFVTVGKNGPKLKESSQDPPPPDPKSRVAQDVDGFPSLPPGYSGVVGMPSAGRIRLSGQRAKIGQLLSWLQDPLGRTVIDQTGLTGLYDFKVEMEWHSRPGTVADPSDPAPSPSAAMDKLGLKLDSQKMPFDFLVIDKIDKQPTGN